MSVGIPDAHLDAGTLLPSLLTSSARLGEGEARLGEGELRARSPLRTDS
jgi:hypothetical protein